MKKFQAVVNEVYARILEQETVPAAIPQTGGPVTPTTTGQEPAPAPAPAPAPEPTQEPQPLTPAGKVFLIDYIRKALAVDPGTLTADEKAIFNEPEVNAENGDQILTRLQEIIDSRQ